MELLPDLPSLRLLRDVARLGSIGAAGRVSGISQQSASERLRAIETRTGLILLQRATTGSTLTPEGRLMVEWTRPVLEQADEAEAALRTLRHDRTRELRVYASMTTAEFLAPRWLVQLRRERDTTASLHATNSGAVLDAVRNGKADLGLIEAPADLSGLASRVIGGDSLVLVAAPDDRWARRRRPLQVEEIAHRRLTSRESGSGTRQVVEAAFGTHGVEPPVPEVEFTTTSAILAAVRAGSPPAFVSNRAVRGETGVGRLVEIPVADLALDRDFTAVWIGRRIPPPGPVRDLLAIAGRPRSRSRNISPPGDRSPR